MIEIIPAIDLIDGKCVRLQQGDYATQKVYNENPVAVAQAFEQAGIRRLHVVDLDGAKRGSLVNLAVLEEIAQATQLVIDYGGGVKTATDVQDILNAGARWATIGSAAVKQPEAFAQWVDEFGPEALMLGADVKGRLLAVGGWLETTAVDIFDFLSEKIEMGLLDVFCTDISKDGMLAGPAVELYAELHARFDSLRLIASGGVSSEADVWAAQAAGCSGVIIGKAIYEGRIQLENLLKGPTII